MTKFYKLESDLISFVEKMNQKILSSLVLMLIFLSWCSNQLPPADENNIHMCLMGGGEDCETIFDPVNQSTYWETIQKVCEMMPMDKCKNYFSAASWAELSETDIEKLPEVKPSQIVKLASGDVYEMEITEVKMKIRDKRVKMLSYNGSIPGPTFKVTKWAQIIVKLTNKAPSLVTTLHSHGLRLNHLFDWVPKGMMGSQDPMRYGDSFSYQLKFPDAGLFRYHPHMDEQIQQELGLYGNYLVTDEDKSDWQKNSFNSEQALILDDIQLTPDGIPQVQKNPDNQSLMGRYGNQMLINGQEYFSFGASSGDIVRLYLTNTANVRPFLLAISWAKLKLIASDLSLYERPEFIDSLLIWPAERYIVDVYFPTAWDFFLTNLKNQNIKLATIHVSSKFSKNSYSAQFQKLISHQKLISEIDSYRKHFNKPVDKTLILDVAMNMNHWNMMEHASSDKVPEIIKMPGLSYSASSIEREDTMKMMNDMSDNKNTVWKLIDNQTKKENMAIDRSFKKWDLVKVRIINKSNSEHPMQHPIHFHGQRFLILTHNMQKNTNLVRKDTVLLWAWDTVDLLIDMSNPWNRMAHCHIAEHLMNGMMFHYSVY